MSDSAGRVRSPVSPGDVVGGKYRVERVLGSGGMGVVVAARHIDLDQPVALKFILPQALAGKGNVERFLREARAAVRLKSEHVARVYDVGRDGDDRPYMVLELLEGMDLAKLSKQKGPFPVADAVEYVLQACEALVEAHAAGIVHRDLKPQNLFVTRRLNGTPLVKVLDFGISKAIGPAAEGQMALTDSTAVIGSPLYMAPEQMRSARAAEIRSDVWALGVILYELLGGQLPFDGETVTEVCIRVVNEQPPGLLELRPALDPSLVAIVMRCLAKEPDGRFHNVAALAAALEPFSRSAKQGGPVRPWRSFEDTQDSAAGNPFAVAPAGAADATGPSTAVTIQSLPADAMSALAGSGAAAAVSEDERRARALAGSTKASAGSRGEAPPHLASTDVTWGDSTAGADRKPKRSFTTGLFAGAVAALCAAALVGGVFLGRRTSMQDHAVSASAAPPVKAEPAPEEKPSVAAKRDEAPASAPAGAPQVVDPALSAPSVKAASAVTNGRAITPTSSASAAAAARLLGRRAPAARPVAEPAPASVAPAAAAAPERAPEKSDTVSPNGAPILH